MGYENHTLSCKLEKDQSYSNLPKKTTSPEIKFVYMSNKSGFKRWWWGRYILRVFFIKKNVYHTFTPIFMYSHSPISNLQTFFKKSVYKKHILVTIIYLNYIF